LARICCVTHHYYPQHAHIRRDMETLVNAGYGVDVICLRHKGQKGKETIDGVNIYRMSVEHKRLGLLRYLTEYSAFFVLATLKLWSGHLRKRYAVIEVNNMPDILVFTTLFPKMLGARVILYVFDPMPEYLAFKHRLRSNHPAINIVRWCERASAAYADQVIVTANSVKRMLESRGTRGSKISIVLNVPDEGIFCPDASFKDVREDGNFRVMTHGSILQNYGIQTIIKAVPILIGRIPKLEVLIVGEGEYLDELRTLAHDLAIEDYVKFTGYIPHEKIPSMISQADVGVVSVLNDPMLPTKLFEYLAMAKPVVIADQPAMKEYFDSSSMAFYQPDNEHDLARCILELHGNPQKRAVLAERAKEAYEKYRWSTMKDEYLRVFEKST